MAFEQAAFLTRGRFALLTKRTNIMLIDELKAPAADWISLNEAQQISRVSRATLYGLMKVGAIKSSSLAIPGNSRGRRLISSSSLLAYIERASTGGGK